MIRYEGPFSPDRRKRTFEEVTFLKGMETVHQEGDEVPLLPPAGGGSGVFAIEFSDHN